MRSSTTALLVVALLVCGNVMSVNLRKTDTKQNTLNAEQDKSQQAEPANVDANVDELQENSGNESSDDGEQAADDFHENQQDGELQDANTEFIQHGETDFANQSAKYDDEAENYDRQVEQEAASFIQIRGMQGDGGVVQEDDGEATDSSKCDTTDEDGNATDQVDADGNVVGGGDGETDGDNDTADQTAQVGGDSGDGMQIGLSDLDTDVLPSIPNPIGSSTDDSGSGSGLQAQGDEEGNGYDELGADGNSDNGLDNMQEADGAGSEPEASGSPSGPESSGSPSGSHSGSHSGSGSGSHHSGSHHHHKKSAHHEKY